MASLRDSLFLFSFLWPLSRFARLRSAVDALVIAYSLNPKKFAEENPIVFLPSISSKDGDSIS